MTRSAGFAQRHPGFGVFVVGLGTLVVPFDSSVNVAFPHIVRGFDLPIPSIQWVVIAYTLTYAALTLVFGRAGDMVGYRPIFQAGNLIGAAAFLACAAATDFGWLLAARVLQGVGAALALSCGPALATSLYPEDQRTRVLGLYTMMFGIGAVLGTVVAGELVNFFGWQAVFWFRAPIALLSFALTWTLPKGSPRGQQTFDLPGATLLVLAIAAFLATLNQLRTLNQSVAGFAVAAFVTALSVWGFIRQENRAAQPILSLRFFKDPDFALVTGAHALVSLSGFSIMLLVPFYLDRLGGLSVPMSGLVLGASPIGIMLSGPLGARLLTLLSPRQSALLAAIVMAAAQIAIGLQGEPAQIPVLAAAMFVQGFGMGLFQIVCFDISTATLPREDRGVAGSLAAMTRTVGVVTAATVLMLIFQTLRATAARNGVPDGEAFLAGFQGAFQIAATLPILVAIAGLLRGWARKG